MKKIISILIFTYISLTVSAQGERWTEERINKWYEKQPWLCGMNYIPADAINYTARWDKTSFSPTVIEKEMALAKSIGMNCVRVVLQHAVYEDDPQYFPST